VQLLLLVLPLRLLRVWCSLHQALSQMHTLLQQLQPQMAQGLQQQEC
jgi:hypothetical protein